MVDVPSDSLFYPLPILRVILAHWYFIAGRGEINVDGSTKDMRPLAGRNVKKQCNVLRLGSVENVSHKRSLARFYSA